MSGLVFLLLKPENVEWSISLLPFSAFFQVETVTNRQSYLKFGFLHCCRKRKLCLWSRTRVASSRAPWGAVPPLATLECIEQYTEPSSFPLFSVWDGFFSWHFVTFIFETQQRPTFMRSFMRFCVNHQGENKTWKTWTLHWQTFISFWRYRKGTINKQDGVKDIILSIV